MTIDEFVPPRDLDKDKYKKVLPSEQKKAAPRDVVNDLFGVPKEPDVTPKYPGE